MWRISQMFAKSKLVPSHFHGDPNSCWIACQMAIRLGVDPFMFMQNTYIVQGKPGMEAKLAIALVNTSGIFKGPIQWKMEGEGMSRKATAMAIHAQSGQVCECTVSMETAKAEGWIDKQGSKWKTMPEQMLRYRSAAWFARLFCPERLMGMQTVDELEDVLPPKRVQNTAAGAAGLVSRLGGTAPEDIVDQPEQPQTDDQRPTQEERDTSIPTGDFVGRSAEAAEDAWQTLCKLAQNATGLGGDSLAQCVDAFIEDQTPEDREESYSRNLLVNKVIRDMILDKAKKANDEAWTSLVRA